MRLFITLTIFCFVIIVLADPEPTGGGICEKDLDCGGPGIGICETIDNTTFGNCTCDEKYANPFCSYKRINKDLAGGLQFICFAGIGGVGNFVLGRYGPAVGQLVLTISWLISVVIGCIYGCTMIASLISFTDNDDDDGFFSMMCGGVSMGIIVAISCLVFCAVFVGIIWSVVDGALILGGDVLDGNGYATY